MKYDLSNKDELRDFESKVIHLKALKKLVELKECRNTRTIQQNKALHKFFTMISEQLNDLGMEFQYFGVKGQQLSLRYNPTIVKDYFWKPIQMALFDFESTTKLKTNEMNEIIDVIIKFFADKGIVLEFPSVENMEKNNFDN